MIPNTVRTAIRVLNPFRDTADRVEQAINRLYDRADVVHSGHVAKTTALNETMVSIAHQLRDAHDEQERARKIRSRIAGILAD